MEKSQIFQYNGQAVTFQLSDGSVMVNATEMAKPFGKQPYEYLRLPSTNELIKAIAGKSRIAENQIIKSVRGGLNPATWLHEDVALDFAQWLSVDFKLWCNDRIKELLRHGITATQPAIDSILSDPDNAIKLLTALKQERAARERLEAQNEENKQQLQLQAPKVKYYHEVIDSEGLLSINKIALDLGMSAIKLNRILCEKHIQYRESDTYLLYSKYRDMKLAAIKPHPYIDSNGQMKTRQHLYWTERGRKFIHDILKNELKYTAQCN